MAIIKSSKKFEGSDLKQGSGNYLRTDVRVMNFRDKKLIDGAYVFILPPYKEDAAGNGVWYKPLKIRDNFGMDTKEKFAVPTNCPIDYFAGRVKTYAPHLKTEKTKDDQGRERNVYQPWGRTTWRVIYNAAFFKDLAAGVNILDLPQFGGHTVIEEDVKSKTPEGFDNPLLNDHTAAYPISVKLDLTAKGQPWVIHVNRNKAYQLPNELADSDYLYNLDEIVLYPSRTELLEKLRTVIPATLFDKCMAGYTDGSVNVSMATPVNIQNTAGLPEPEDDLSYKTQAPAQLLVSNPIQKATRPTPTASVAPTFNLPQGAGQPRPAAQATTPDSFVDAPDADDLPTPPVPTSAAAFKQAKAMLSGQPLR